MDKNSILKTKIEMIENGIYDPQIYSKFDTAKLISILEYLVGYLVGYHEKELKIAIKYGVELDHEEIKEKIVRILDVTEELKKRSRL